MQSHSTIIHDPDMKIKDLIFEACYPFKELPKTQDEKKQILNSLTLYPYVSK